MAFTVDAVHFNCRFTFHTISGETVYTCRPSVDLTQSTTLENVTGFHQPGFTNEDVGFLYVYDQNLPFVPKGIVDFFKNLIFMEFQDTFLLSIRAEDLQPFPQLESLVLSWNRLISLDADLFSFNPLLQRIDIAYNQIQHIGHDLVTNLDNLRHLGFTGNTCIDRSALSRAAVLELAPQLSVLCPPLDDTTTVATTIPVTTTGLPVEQCPCGEKIERLREVVQEQNLNIVHLQESKLAIEKRLLDVEMKLLEILSTPGSE